MQWVIGDVVGIENALAFQALPRLALATLRRRPSALQLCIIAGVQRHEVGQHHQMLLVVDDGNLGFLLH
jgi:hypothetical protein